MTYKILTIGWEPNFIEIFLAPIEKTTGIDFVHGLVGCASRVGSARQEYPDLKFVALSKNTQEPLPIPDFELLVRLECPGVPTIKSMIQGDRVLRYRPESEAFGYATLLAIKIRDLIEELKPDLILASHDSLHSAISLAVAKSVGVPWVALAFPVIPENLTGFCNSLTPDSLVPMVRQIDDELRKESREIIKRVRSKEQKVVAYRAPVSLSQWVSQYILHARNFVRRKKDAGILGVDRYIYPSAAERFADVIRRSINRLRLPTNSMLQMPPGGGYVYFPFHMAPESMLDTWAPFYQNQIAFVSQLALAIPVDMTFVVKLHFSDPDNYSRNQLQQLMEMPKLCIAHPNASGAAFLEKASLVIGIQGTSCLEAALLGKPVLIFGDSPYQHFPRTERAKRPDEIHKQIQQILSIPSPTDDEIVNAYASYLSRYFPGRINDWGRPIEPQELSRLANCFVALGAYLTDASNRINWYKRPPFIEATSMYEH